MTLRSLLKFSRNAAILLMLSPPLFAQASNTNPKNPNKPSQGTSMTAVKFTTSMGSFTLQLDAAKAPKTVENFLQYVRDGHYTGTVFHRVIGNFMVQGGGFEKGMKQKPTRAPVENEANNGLKNDNYTVAMARTSDPHSASAQFFINVKNNDFLNHSAPTSQGWGYAVFGKVSEGMDTVDAIKKVQTSTKGGHGDVPTVDVVIEKAEIL
jgi:peptidyl-prolyl cis-trans isomerase B (cyclophilin B)